MAERYLQTLLTPSALAAQNHYYGRCRTPGTAPAADRLTDEERLFIEARDSFYMASITENGWPYVQHRGGSPGFLRVLSPTQLAFPDFQGNRQLISTGNFAVNERVSLFLMDYPRQERLKILGHARVEDIRSRPELLAQWQATQAPTPGGGRGLVIERRVVIDVIGFDWNCPQHITPRYTESEVRAALAPLEQRIAELEAQLKAKAPN
jgi:uncharacterized protein